MKSVVVITPENYIEGEEQAVIALCKLGCRVHLRKPNSTPHLFELFCQKIIPFCQKERLSIHYFHEIAAKFGVDSHFSFDKIKSCQSKVVSCSTHSISEGLQAEKEGVNYYFLSPIFNSISKNGYSAAFEMEKLNQFLTTQHSPLSSCVALGGVSLKNLEQLKNFDSIALLGSIWSGIDRVSDSEIELITVRFNQINRKWQQLKECNI